MEETPDIETEKANSALQHVRTNFWSMMSEERLDSFMAEVPIIYLFLSLQSVKIFCFSSTN